MEKLEAERERLALERERQRREQERIVTYQGGGSVGWNSRGLFTF